MNGYKRRNYKYKGEEEGKNDEIWAKELYHLLRIKKKKFKNREMEIYKLEPKND